MPLDPDSGSPSRVCRKQRNDFINAVYARLGENCACGQNIGKCSPKNARKAKIWLVEDSKCPGERQITTTRQCAMTMSVMVVQSTSGAVHDGQGEDKHVGDDAGRADENEDDEVDSGGPKLSDDDADIEEVSLSHEKLCR